MISVFYRKVYLFRCNSQEGEESDEKFLESCHGTLEFYEKEEAVKQGWRIIDEYNTLCPFCSKFLTEKI